MPVVCHEISMMCLGMPLNAHRLLSLISSFHPILHYNRTRDIARKLKANKPETAAKGIPVHLLPRLRPHLNVRASNGPATSPPTDCIIARAEYSSPASSWWQKVVTRLRAAGPNPEPKANITIPTAASATAGAAEMISDPTVKKATETRLMRRSLPGALIPRTVRSLLRAGRPSRSSKRLIAALSVIKRLA